MTIADSLILLNSTKQAIKTAIENKGVTVGSIPFAQYPGKIGDIPTGIELPEIGESFGGGYFMGIVFLSDGAYANIVSPLSSGQSGEIQFKTSTTTDSSAVDRVDTRNNMPSIDDEDHPAAQFCTSLSIGGKTDWALPSILQLMAAMNEGAQRNWMAPGSEMGFELAMNYWSSAQYTAANAIVASISGAGRALSLLTTSKTTNTNMRARAFRLEKLE